MRLSEEQRLDWLRLIRSATMSGRAPSATLVNHCGGARAALAALPDARPPRRRIGAGAHLLARGCRARIEGGARASASTFVALGEPDYPPRLQMIDDAPPLLAVRGKLAALALPMVAIVGSRNASAAGVKFAERLARDLGEAGFGIVSGLARGIDAAAHRASLATGTVAVLAGGHDRIYPPEHTDLLERDPRRTAPRVSEMPLGWEPRARDFPRRNRLISGLVARRGRGRGGAPLRLADHRAAWRSNRAARCSRCPARRSIRAPKAPTGCSSRARRWSPRRPT